jgi:hypothetical protein
VRAERVTGGLWIWRAPHPDWRPGRPGSVDDWPREVWSVLYETEDVAVFIDPQLPPERERFWAWADVRCAGCDVVVLTTIAFHARSREAVVERYGAASAGEAMMAEHEPPLPAGVECLRIAPAGETLVWLAAAQTLVAGDSLVGDGHGGLRLCPESWLDFAPEPIDHGDLRDALIDLTTSLPIERVLVAHGEPIRAAGRRALDRALAVPRIANSV